MSDYADVHTSSSTCQTSWSSDGGRTWSEMKPALYGDVSFLLPNGDLQLLPYYLRPAPGGGITAPYQIARNGSHDLKVIAPGVTVTGWPKLLGSLAPKLGLAGFVFNGNSIRTNDGQFLAMLYGYFEGDKIFSLVCAESSDGVAWKIRSVVADKSCGFKGSGPCESAVCRVKDGRLMCVFRADGGLPFGQTFSADEGKTWDKPVLMKDVFSVQPSIMRVAGTLFLSSGRPGIYVWCNLDGMGRNWEKIDIMAHHNACRPDETITAEHTSSYTEIVALDDSSALLIYDRIPHGWHAIPKDSPDTNSVWVVRLALKRKALTP